MEADATVTTKKKKKEELKNTKEGELCCTHSSSMDIFYTAMKRTLTDMRTDRPTQVQPSVPAVAGGPPRLDQHLRQTQQKPDAINGRQTLPSSTESQKSGPHTHHHLSQHFNYLQMTIYVH